MSTRIRSRIGDMRHEIEVQRRTMTQDTFGAPGYTWETLGKIRAAVEPLAGKEAWQAKQVRPDTTHLVTVRYYEGLTSRDRFLHRNRVLQISDVRNLEERDRYMQCECVEESVESNG